MSPCRLSSRWWNLTTGRRALLTTWTLCTLGTQRRRIAATSSSTSAGEAVEMSMSDRMESSERPSSDMPSPAWRKMKKYRVVFHFGYQLCWSNTPIIVCAKISDLFCGGLGTGLEHLGVFQVQEQIQVAGVDAESVDRWTKLQNLAFCKTSNIQQN